MHDRVLLDADIREPLFYYLEQIHGKVRFLEEKVTGKARADVVMVLNTFLNTGASYPLNSSKEKLISIGISLPSLDDQK